jgi:hypothetical protein
MSEDDKQLVNATTNAKSGSLGRLIVILVFFGILAAGIWGGRKYLDSTVPKGDENFVKAKGDTEDEPEATGMEVISDIFSSKESKEVAELKGKSADEVAFTYAAILKMSSADLDKNIQDLSKQLVEIRSTLPPSTGAGSMGAASNDSSEKKKTTPVAFVALPLEVMKQIAGSK